MEFWVENGEVYDGGAKEADIINLRIAKLALQAPQFQPAPKDNEHEWGVIGNITMCKKCGWLKGGKKASEPCKGSPGISLRETVMTEAQPAPPSVDDIRALGWAVAVHNDYRLDGVTYTFWLFTKDGRAVKGEGRTDAAALKQAHLAIEAITRLGVKG